MFGIPNGLLMKLGETNPYMNWKFPVYFSERRIDILVVLLIKASHWSEEI